MPLCVATETQNMALFENIFVREIEQKSLNCLYCLLKRFPDTKKSLPQTMMTTVHIISVNACVP